MARMIKLHQYLSGDAIWLNADAIISVVDEGPVHSGAGIYTFAGEPLAYMVEETPEKVVELIEESRRNRYENCKTPD